MDSTTREIIDDCLARAKKGDTSAPFDLAGLMIAHADAKDIDLNLAVVETLALISKQMGYGPAGDFLNEEWEGMKQILRKRWARNGLVNSQD